MRKLHACVLVVDDNEINRMVTSEQLLELGYQVQVATNGREAVDFVQQYECAAVLMDCEMPVMDGYAATREIRRLGHKHIPIIAVSAHDDAKSRARMIEAGMDGHVGRPLTGEQLASALTRFVRMSMTSEQQSLQKPISIDATDIELDAGIPRCTEVLQLTLELVPAQIDAIGDALTRGDAEAARARTHKLKGSALSIGARRMAHVARGLERDLRDGAEVDAQNAIDSLRERFEQLLPLLHEEMRCRPSGRPTAISA
jgi:CheY-like chemotaxis protein/HPt (histidine-containing phosphotransfer) domain-containing protein